MTKDALKHFHIWTNEHQYTFDAIKGVVSANCLTVIDCQELEYLHFTMTIFYLNYGLIQLFPFELIIVIHFALPSMDLHYSN